jgi:glycine oxidase
MDYSADVAIIGGGIIGCSVAYFLRKQDVEVAVFDQGEIGAQASSAAAGILAPLGTLSGPGPYADLLLASWAMFPALVPEIEEASGIAVEYEQGGVLRVIRDTHNVGNLRKRMREWQPLGLQMLWLTGDEVRRYEPLLASDVSAAVYAPQEAQLKAAKLTRAFAQAAANRGAKLYSHTEILGIQSERQRVTGLYTAQGETIACHHLVIATGAWTAQCGSWLDISLPVSPQRGQILTVKQPAQPLRHVIFGEAVYLAPKKDHTIVIGATKEEVGFDKHVTAGGLAWLLSTAIRLAPMLDGCAVEQTWAGLRPKTPDNHPILGKAPHWANVSLATGHNSVGLMLSPITGQSIANLITKDVTADVIKPFGAERFSSANP